MNPQLFMALVGCVSMIGSGIGVYVGMKVGLTRLETWKEIAAEEMRVLRNDVNVTQDDCLIFDGEIDVLYENEGLHRAVRQRARRR